MTIAYFCIVIAALIPMLCAGFAKIFGGTYNNSNPREFLDKLEGKAKRAHYAQLNSLEAFPPFAAGVIVAHQLHAAQHLLDILAVSFVALRIVYVICYVTDKASLRSLIWFAGLFVTITLYFIGNHVS